MSEFHGFTTQVVKNKKHPGRDPTFKCSGCGQYVKYDRRTVNIDYNTASVFNAREEQWFPEEEVIFTHKKCDA